MQRHQHGSTRFRFDHLDEETRALMVDEVNFDRDPTTNGVFYEGRRLTPSGAAGWPEAVMQALRDGTPESLIAYALAPGHQASTETYHRNGIPTTRRVNQASAAETLAEGTYNRYYIRGVCRLALSRGIEQVEVYRAKESAQPREVSQQRIGQRVDAAALLEDLRNDPSIDNALGIPAGPNSGLSVRLPSDS